VSADPPVDEAGTPASTWEPASGEPPGDAASICEPAAVPRVAWSQPGWEILLVLGVSLGQSAIYSILAIINKLTVNVPLNQQTTTINSSVTPDRPWLDLAYQLAGVVFPAVPALLALYLLRLHGERRGIGLDLTRPAGDLGWGLVVAAGIGIPGLGLYFVARALGFNTIMVPANLAATWWTVPVLLLLAAMNGFLEEVVMIGFFFARTRAMNWPVWATVVASAVIRGSYHLYQGWGGALGNVVMGLAFGWFYTKTKRVAPLVVAHTVLDIVSFVGYALLAPYLSFLH